MTLIQAQNRYIERVNGCHPGHAHRVRRSAWKQLRQWAISHGYVPRPVCDDAHDMALLNQNAED